MAVAVEELTPAVASEYGRLTAGGAMAGRETLQQAQRNVAAQVPAAPRPKQPAVFQSGQAVGPARVVRSASTRSTASAAAQHLPSGGQKGGTGVGIRLIWAAAAGLLALEVLSLATNRYFNWSLKGGLSSLKSAGTYIGLYPGQTAKLAGQAAPSTALSAFGIQGPPDRNTGQVANVPPDAGNLGSGRR